MYALVLDDQKDHTYNITVWTQNVDWMTCWERLILGKIGERERERESGKSVPATWLDDDDDDGILISIYANTTNAVTIDNVMQ